MQRNLDTVLNILLPLCKTWEGFVLSFNVWHHLSCSPLRLVIVMLSCQLLLVRQGMDDRIMSHVAIGIIVCERGVELNPKHKKWSYNHMTRTTPKRQLLEAHSKSDMVWLGHTQWLLLDTHDVELVLDSRNLSHTSTEVSTWRNFWNIICWA